MIPSMIFGYLIGKMGRENNHRHYDDIEPVTLGGLLKALAFIVIGTAVSYGMLSLVVVLANHGGLISLATWSVLCFLAWFICSWLATSTLCRIREGHAFRNYNTKYFLEWLDWWESPKMWIGFWTVIVLIASIGTFVTMRG